MAFDKNDMNQEFKNVTSMEDITQDDFTLVQENVKLSDKKLETKQVTFLKDALKRFVKNKSSVVGAVILGILVLLAIFVPVISRSNISVPHEAEIFLEPKLFNAGTGFWDGTRKYTNVTYDTVNKMPATPSDRQDLKFIRSAISNLVIYPEPELVNNANEFGIGGYLRFTNNNGMSNNEQESIKIATLKSYATKFTASGNYQVKIALINEEDVLNSKLGEYAIYLVYNDTNNVEQKIILKDWSTDYQELNLNISNALQSAGLDEVLASLVFELKPIKNYNSYLLVESCLFTALESVENYEELTTKISFSDATKMVLQKLAIDENGRTYVPVGYWVSTGNKNIYKSKIYKCDFTYDTYEAAYGLTDENQYLDITATTLKEWIDKGWCKYDEKVGPSSFEILDEEKCPIQSIVRQEFGPTGKLLTVYATGYKYFNLGYQKMPKFLLGTDAAGHDIFKKAFKGLRTSLILGICTAAFCFAFGLCWGAISGYFGGNVDLFMERFCDILSGVPWIVVMTLCILHLGNNFFTFFLALCLTGWMGIAGRTRTQFYRFKGREYVLASRTLGSSDIRLIFKHILPNSLGTIITSSVLMIPSVIFSEATLAYLNLGLQGSQSFGVMLSDNQKYLEAYPNLILFPASIISLIMISFNLFGNGLRDALNPSLKGSD